MILAWRGLIGAAMLALAFAALPGCADYLSCKERYYFQSILENLIDTDWTPEEFLEMRLGGRLPPGVAASVGLTGPAAAKAVADLEARLREKRAVVVVVPLSPVENRPRMAWLPQAGQFVEIE